MTHTMKSAARTGTRAMAAVLCAGALLACAPAQKEQIKNAKEYTVAMSTVPDPLQVGETAEISARVEKQNDKVKGCFPRFRQFMPDHEMADDFTWYDMQEAEPGIYRARGGEFHMGGDWIVLIQINCDKDAEEMRFRYHVAWPE